METCKSWRVSVVKVSHSGEAATLASSTLMLNEQVNSIGNTFCDFNANRLETAIIEEQDDAYAQLFHNHFGLILRSKDFYRVLAIFAGKESDVGPVNNLDVV